MARRKQASDTLTDLLIKLPPGVCLSLGVASYVGLEWFQRTHVATQGNLSLSIATSSYPPIALGIFVAFAAISAVHRVRREKLVDQQTGLDSLRHTPWKDFEYLVAESFHRQGYATDYSLDEGPDGGVDIVLKKKGRMSLVQCKRWKNGSVGVAVVREMLGILHARQAHEVFIITTGGFTAEAHAFAKGNPISLIDGARLWNMVVAVQAVSIPAKAVPPPSATAAPECPQCGGEMVRRTAKQGPTTGTDFWGCPRYPSCRGTVSIHAEPPLEAAV
jgi:restriction system protein